MRQKSNNNKPLLSSKYSKFYKDAFSNGFMAYNGVSPIRERFVNSPLVAVVGTMSSSSSHEMYQLGSCLREGVGEVDGVMFTAGLPSWIVEFYRGVKDHARSVVNQAFGAALRNIVSQEGDGRDLFFLLFPEDFQESLRNKARLYKGLYDLNNQTALEYCIRGKSLRETVSQVVPEIADAVVLFGGDGSLAHYAHQVIAAGKPIIPITTSGGAAALLARFGQQTRPTPREVAELASYGVIIEPEQKQLIQPVYDPSRLKYGLRNTFSGETIEEQLPTELPLIDSGDPLLTAEIPKRLSGDSPSRLHQLLFSVEIEEGSPHLDIIDNSPSSKKPEPKLADIIRDHITLFGKKDTEK